MRKLIAHLAKYGRRQSPRLWAQSVIYTAKTPLFGFSIPAICSVKIPVIITNIKFPPVRLSPRETVKQVYLCFRGQNKSALSIMLPIY